jgi:hypothetical protein
MVHLPFVFPFPASTRLNKKAGHTKGDTFGSPADFFKIHCFPRPSFEGGWRYREL